MTDLELQIQFYKDCFETRRLKNEAIPEEWKKNLAILEAQARGDHITTEDPNLFARDVPGRPDHEPHPMFHGLVPFKIQPGTDLTPRIEAAESLRNALQTKLAKAETIATTRVKATPKAKAEALKYLKSMTATEDQFHLAALANETIPELYRLQHAANPQV